MKQYAWLGGVVTPLITPLTEDEQLDLVGLEHLLKSQIENNVHGLFVLGSAGEGPMLPSALRRRVMRYVVRQTNGKIPVVAGVMNNSVALVLERLKELQEFGIKAGVVTLPYYHWQGNKDSAVSFFLTLADKSPIPIVLYNLPWVNSKLTLGIVERLFNHPNIAGIKDSGNSPQEMKRIIKSTRRPKRFKFLIGNSSLAGEVLLSGADGIVSVHSNVFPALVMDFYNSAKAKNYKRVEYLQKCMDELQKILKFPNTPGGIKCALNILGICDKRTMRPWPQADERHASKVSRLITKVKKMYSN